jgi:hypothetical protein
VKLIPLTLENIGIIIAVITPIGLAIAFFVKLQVKVNNMQRALNTHPLLVLFKTWEENQGGYDFLNSILKSREVEKKSGN